MWPLLPSSTMTPPWPSTISLRTRNPQRLFLVSSQSLPTQNNNTKTGVEFKTKHRSFTGQQQQQQKQQQQQQLSGSDVLWALKRATAEKAKKMKKEPVPSVTYTSRAPKEDGNGESKVTDCTTVRPLTIKTEWSDRLEQLEKRLDQLLHV